MSEYEVPLDEIDKGTYDEPTEVKFRLSESGELGRVFDHLTPEETAEFHRLREAQANVDEGGMGAVKQRHGGTQLMQDTVAEARANLAHRGRA